MLQGESGIDLEVILARGYESIATPQALAAFRKSQPVAVRFSLEQTKLAPALLIPVWTTDGRNGPSVLRPDVPRFDGRRGKARKYELPPGAGVRLDCPPRCLPQLGNPSIPLWVTEGIKKGDALASRDLCAVALLGVWNFKGKNDFGGVTWLADWDYIALGGREVRITFDTDVMRKPDVRQALARLTEHLQRKGAHVRSVYLPLDGPKGVDEFLVARGVAALEALVEQPRPAPQAAPPLVELLDEAPPTLTRPLALVDGHAYAATWLQVRRTIPESLDKNREVVRHDPPRVETRQELHVVRDDGRLFGPAGDAPLEALGLEVRLPLTPPAAHLWRARAVTAYCGGRRPALADVFRRLAAIYNHYLDFARSLVDQATMCELGACLSLLTWLADAFTVLPYVYPNGEKGTGKTHLLNVWTLTSYLGELLTMGGTFAALRDLADYGAALAFDDAENLNDPKRIDPDKRTLLLAGNRRGVSVPLKEPRPDGTWGVRYVSPFCPRGFSAIQPPDDVLGSRAIVLPLVRSGDPDRTNRDPADVAHWPHDRRALIDDLWAAALAALPAAADAWAALDADGSVLGRDYEPWRAVLVAAQLVEAAGVDGLTQRMRAVMHAYQAERADLLDTDRTVAVVRALLQLAKRPEVGDIRDIRTVRDIKWETPPTVETRDICVAIKALAAVDDEDAEWASTRRIGRVLGRLRLARARHHGKARGWEVSASALLGLGRVYGVLQGPPVVTTWADPADDDRKYHDAQGGGPKPNVPNGSNAPNVPAHDPDARCRDCGRPSGGRLRCPNCQEAWVRGR
jgi:hypothetical protein